MRSSGDHIALHYQPFATCDGEVLGVQAVMRWHHRERGTASPETFVPISETSSGMTLPLASWTLREACRDAAGWNRPLRLSVRLPLHQFEGADLVRLVADVLDETGLPPHRLELVVSAPLPRAPGNQMRALSRLTEQAVGITLDPFGTGSLDLEAAPFSKVKIDSFLSARIETSLVARTTVQRLVELAHGYKLTVAVDGADTVGRLAFFRDLGCDVVEGQMIGGPAPIGELAALTGPPRVTWQTRPATQTPDVEPSGPGLRFAMPRSSLQGLGA